MNHSLESPVLKKQLDFWESVNADCFSNQSFCMKSLNRFFHIPDDISYIKILLYHKKPSSKFVVPFFLKVNKDLTVNWSSSKKSFRGTFAYTNTDEILAHFFETPGIYQIWIEIELLENYYETSL